MESKCKRFGLLDNFSPSGYMRFLLQVWKKCPKVKGLPSRCLLLLENAPTHLPDLEEHFVKEFDSIQVEFIPPCMTPMLQPIDQEVISNFNKLYTKGLFRKCFEITNDN